MSGSESLRPPCSAFPPVLDACCGGKRFWFDKHDGRTFYVDQRSGVDQIDARPGRKPQVIDPDWQGDFTAMPFPDNTFAHVVFDPPHLTTLTTDTGWLARQYGRLQGDWREMLRKGFAECFRVLRPEGTLIFKWCEYNVPVSEVLALTPEKPLYGHRSGKQSKTHWIAFLKPNARREFPADSAGKLDGIVGASDSTTKGE